MQKSIDRSSEPAMFGTRVRIGVIVNQRDAIHPGRPNLDQPVCTFFFTEENR
jgi:hypothetical protein